MRKKEQVSIGVLGLHPCAGATHLSLLLASYFCHCKKKRTLLAEESGKDDLKYFEIFLHGKENGAGEFYGRRCCYRRGSLAGEKKGSGEWAECLIYDFGCSYAAAEKRLLACDIKWIIGSSGIFRREEWKKFFSESGVREQIMLQGTGKWHFLHSHAKTGQKTKVFLTQDGWKKQNLEIYGLGVEQNILHPSKAAIDLFSRMEIEK